MKQIHFYIITQDLIEFLDDKNVLNKMLDGSVSIAALDIMFFITNENNI